MAARRTSVFRWGAWFGVAGLVLLASTCTEDPVRLPDSGGLLLGGNGFGGATLSPPLALTNGQWADHQIPLPFDPTLAGLRLYTQAAMGKPSGIELLNALDITVGLQ